MWQRYVIEEITLSQYSSLKIVSDLGMKNWRWIQGIISIKV